MRKRLLLPLLLLVVITACEKEEITAEKEIAAPQQPITASKPIKNKSHGNSMSFTLASMQVNAESFSVEQTLSANSGRLLNIGVSQPLDGAVPSSITLRLNIDGYNGVPGTFLFGAPVGWGGTSTTTATFSIPVSIYPPSREGTFEIKEVKKRGNGEIITGTFSIIFGFEGFNDWHLTDGHFSLFIPKI